MVDLLEHLVQDAPNPRGAPGKWQISRLQNCINCGRCATSCIYGVHNRREDDPRWMNVPETSLCKGCYNCLEVCPVDALELSYQPQFETLGGGIIRPNQVLTIWGEASNGKIPVTGGGYKGPFSGKGFDSMWTDMSEIVRPTRDGIHGRERIYTAIDVGRRPVTVHEEPRVIQLRVPFIFSLPFRSAAWPRLGSLLERAAALVGTMSLEPLPGHEGRVWRDPRGRYAEVLLDSPDTVVQDLAWLRQHVTVAVYGVRVWARAGLEEKAEALAQADVIHVMAPLDGWVATDVHVKDVLRAVHERLVELGIRNRITILASGGVHVAEHVPKAIINGADGVVLDVATVAALGCRVCESCTKGAGTCPDGLHELEPGWSVQRLVNLSVAWRDQLLEILGAMGMRDVRRLRGETGRAMEAGDMVALAFQGIEGAPTYTGGGGHH